MYFHPDLERQNPERKAAKDMMIAIMKIKTQERDFLNWIQEMAKRLIAKLIPGHYGEVNCEELMADLKDEHHRNECFK